MSPRVLLVDDDREHLRHLAQTLYHAGFQVQTEQRGSAALEAMRGQPPDALVLELMLPEMSGFRLIEAARRMAPPECLAIVVTTDIFTTRHCREDAIQRFGLLGMLAKPTDPAQVVELLCQQAAAGQSQLAPRFEEDSRALGAAPPRPLSSSEGPEPEEVTQPNIIQPRFEAEEVPLLEPSPPTAAAAAAAAQPREAMRVLTPLAPAFAERLQPRPLASVRLEGIVPRPPTSGEEEELPETLLRGDFLQTPFPALLFGLSEQRATGALYLRQERKKKVIQLHKGKPRQIKSNLLPECLGRILLREGMIDEHDLEESLSRMKVRQMLQGEALVEMGSLSAKSLRLGLELQIEAKLLEIFTWPYGAFRFQPGEEVLPDEAELPVQVEELVRRGMLRFYPAEKVREEFDGLRNRQPACTDDRRLLQRPMGLTEEEQAFLHALDGSATAEQIVRHGGLSRDHAERLLLALLHVRRVQLLPRGSRLATPTAPAAAPR